MIIRGIRQIYNLYLANDAKKNVDSSKLNVNIREELMNLYKESPSNLYKLLNSIRYSLCCICNIFLQMIG